MYFALSGYVSSLSICVIRCNAQELGTVKTLELYHDTRQRLSLYAEFNFEDHDYSIGCALSLDALA